MRGKKAAVALSACQKGAKKKQIDTRSIIALFSHPFRPAMQGLPTRGKLVGRTSNIPVRMT